MPSLPSIVSLPRGEVVSARPHERVVTLEGAEDVALGEPEPTREEKRAMSARRSRGSGRMLSVEDTEEVRAGLGLARDELVPTRTSPAPVASLFPVELVSSGTAREAVVPGSSDQVVVTAPTASDVAVERPLELVVAREAEEPVWLPAA